MPTVADDTPYAHPIHPAAVHAMQPDDPRCRGCGRGDFILGRGGEGDDP